VNSAVMSSKTWANCISCWSDG